MCICQILPGGIECRGATSQGTCPAVENNEIICFGDSGKLGADAELAVRLVHVARSLKEADGMGHLSDGKLFLRSQNPCETISG